MLGLLWFVQRRITGRMHRSSAAEAITVIGRRGLGAKAQLLIAEAEGNRYVLGVTEHGITVIDRIPGYPLSDAGERTEDADPADITSGFEQLLASESAREQDLPAAPPLRRDLTTARRDSLHGSIISPSTWRQTAEFLRRSR